MIDEIKGVMRDLDHITGPVGVHLAQAKCYAYFYGTQNALEEIGVQMTYCNLETEEIKRFRETYSVGELKKWFEELVHAYENGRDIRLNGKNFGTTRSAGPNFHFRTERDSENWYLLYTGRFSGRRSYSFRRRPEWERRWRRFFRRYELWGKSWGRKFST